MNPMLYPLFVQVLLTFILLYVMGFLRVKAIVSKQVEMKSVALGQLAWPEKVQRVSNCFHNQLETPFLFYVAILLCLHFQIQHISLLFLAWTFVACRIGHAYTEIKSNYVPLRFRWFLAGTSTLLCMWIALIVKIITL